MDDQDDPEAADGLRPSTQDSTHTGPARVDDSLLLHTDLMGNLQVPSGAGRRAELQALASRAAIYATRARSDGTRRVYRSAWRGNADRRRSLGREPLGGDPNLLATYVIKRTDDELAVSTLRVDLAAIRNYVEQVKPSSRSAFTFYLESCGVSTTVQPDLNQRQ